MAQRSVALWKDQYIGIESIFTVCDGKQINIAGKVEELRIRSNNKELFCPCGCGANLTAVIPKHTQRERHFRRWKGTGNGECSAVLEGQESIDAKIALKCWLDDKLSPKEVKYCVPICTIEENSRKYEISLLAPEEKFGISYCHNERNLTDEKLDVLEGNISDIQIIYIAGANNLVKDKPLIENQYPEWLMKIQKRQGYVLFLSAKDRTYEEATLKVAYYEKQANGLWKEHVIVSDLLSRFDITKSGEIIYGSNSVPALIQKERKDWECVLAEERLREQKWQQNLEQRRREEEKKRLEKEEQAKQYVQKLESQRQMEEAKRKQEETEIQKAKLAMEMKEREFQKNLDSILSQQQIPAISPRGIRFVKCERCAKIDRLGNFVSFGGENHENLGICYKCFKRQERKNKVQPPVNHIPVKNDSIPYPCPRCQAKLKIRTGRNGKFIGCSNYPSCNYTESIK